MGISQEQMDMLKSNIPEILHVDSAVDYPEQEFVKIRGRIIQRGKMYGLVLIYYYKAAMIEIDSSSDDGNIPNGDFDIHDLPFIFEDEENPEIES